jgi:hypothetical protein
MQHYKRHLLAKSDFARKRQQYKEMLPAARFAAVSCGSQGDLLSVICSAADLCSHCLLHLQRGTPTAGNILLEPLALQSHCRSKIPPAKRGPHAVRSCSSQSCASGLRWSRGVRISTNITKRS